MTTQLSSNEVKSVMDALEILFASINGTGNYNFYLDPQNIVQEFKSLDEIMSFPYLCLGSARYTMTQTDQQSYEVPLEIEVFGYLKRDEGGESLENGLKFASDLERALFSDETIGGRIYGMNLNFDVVSFDNYVVVGLIIRCSFEYLNQ